MKLEITKEQVHLMIIALDKVTNSKDFDNSEKREALTLKTNLIGTFFKNERKLAKAGK